MPVVLLIAGSGPTDRDGNGPGFTPGSLRQLAESLAVHQIATLRFDKRGVAGSASAAIPEALTVILALVALCRAHGLERSVLAQLVIGYWLFMGVLLPVAMLVVRDGTLYAGYRHTWLYTESPAVVRPLLAVVLLVTYWQWKTLGRADVVSLFRKASVVDSPTARPVV